MNGIVTLDVGSTNLKLNLFTSDGKRISELKEITPYITMEKGLSEIDPEKVLQIIFGMLNEIVKGKDILVEALTISGMAASIIPVDCEGNALFQCICWNDKRNPVDHRSWQISKCLKQYPIPMYLPFRIKWFQENHQEVVAKAFKWINLTDYINYHLSNEKEFVTDYSISSRTMLFNNFTKKWDDSILNFFNINKENLPTAMPAGSILGTLNNEIKQNPKYCKTLLILGGHDHMFASLAGNLKEGVVLNSTGTSEALCFPFNGNESFPFLEMECNLENHIDKNKLVLVSYVASSGTLMEWGNKQYQLFRWEQDEDWKQHIYDLLSRPIFIPPGRRMLPQYEGGFIGTHPDHNFKDYSLAIMEGICFEAKSLLEEVNKELAANTSLVRVVGGSSKTTNFLNLKSSILGIPLEVIRDVDMSSLGCYLLCGHSLKYYDNIQQASETLLLEQNAVTIEPDPVISSLYDSRFKKYLEGKKLYDQNINSWR